IKSKCPCGPARLSDINAMQPTFRSKLQFVLPVYPVNDAQQLMCFLPFLDNAECLGPDAIPASRAVLIQGYDRELFVHRQVHVCRKSQVRDGIDLWEIAGDAGLIDMS